MEFGRAEAGGVVSYWAHLGYISVHIAPIQADGAWILECYWRGDSDQALCNLKDNHVWDSAEEAMGEAEASVKRLFQNTVSASNQVTEAFFEKDPFTPKTALERLLEDSVVPQ